MFGLPSRCRQTHECKPNVIVIGGGLGGLWAAQRIAEAGFQVLLFSLFEVKRSHSAYAQGGINAVLDVKGQHDYEELEELEARFDHLSWSH